MRPTTVQPSRPSVFQDSTQDTDEAIQLDTMIDDAPEAKTRNEDANVPGPALSTPPADFLPAHTEPIVCVVDANRSALHTSWSTVTNGAAGLVDGLTLGITWGARSLLRMQYPDTGSISYRAGLSAGLGIVTVGAVVGVAASYTAPPALDKEDLEKIAKTFGTILDKHFQEMQNHTIPAPLNMTAVGEEAARFADAMRKGS